MKKRTFLAAALLATAFTGVTFANAGPTSKLYLTGNHPNAGGEKIIAVQGQSIVVSADTAYSQNEWAIAAYGDLRTAGSDSSTVGGWYDLQAQAGSNYTQYRLPSSINEEILDATSDGAYNYFVETGTATVYQTARDYTNAVSLFQIHDAGQWSGITYDPASHSLWLDSRDTNLMVQYSLSGQKLSSFNVQNSTNGGLAFDPADKTLWLINYTSSTLEQYSTSGQYLGSLPGYLGIGAEFNLETIGLTPSPEPGSLILFGSGFLGLAGFLRRKINL